MRDIIIDEVYLHFHWDNTGFWVPVKRLCDAFNVDFLTEEKFIWAHPMTKDCTAFQPVRQGDGTVLEEWCIPFKYALGWLGSATKHTFSHHIAYKKEMLEFLHGYFTTDGDPLIIKKLALMGRTATIVE